MKLEGIAEKRNEWGTRSSIGQRNLENVPKDIDRLAGKWQK
jgi:hypothetical protein